MSINSINQYTSISSSLYNNSTSEASTSLVDLLSTDSSSSSDSTSETSSYFSDSTDFSTTTSFFSELRALEETDPETYEELVTALGEKLKSAKGYAGQMLASMSEQVAAGNSIEDVIRQSL